MWHNDFVNRCLNSATPINDAASYGVTINPITPVPSEPYWRCVGVYHLKPTENRGGHYAFCAVRGEAGARVQNAIISANNNGLLSEAKCDKPDDEPDTNVPMRFGDTLTLRVAFAGLRSDTVSGIHTRHADEPGPGGELWNSIGHHSFFMVWQLTIAGTEPEPPEPPIEPPVTAHEVVIHIGDQTIHTADTTVVLTLGAVHTVQVAGQLVEALPEDIVITVEVVAL